MESPDEKDTRSKKARELYRYLDNNRAGLLPYDRQGKEIPEPPEGVVYKGMGAGEPELYRDHPANEEPEDALVRRGSQ